MTDVATSTDVVSTVAAAPEVKTPARAGRLLSVAAVVGVCTDLVVRQAGPGVAWVLWGSSITVGMAFTVARSRRSARVVLAGAWLFVPWFVLRSSAWLLVPNALVKNEVARMIETACTTRPS